MGNPDSIGDELEWMRKRYPNAIRFKTEQKIPVSETIIEGHNDRINDYPEHLTTEFLLELTGCECTKKEKLEWLKLKGKKKKITKDKNECVLDRFKVVNGLWIKKMRETIPQKPINDRFSTITPKLDERCNTFWGILDTLNMGKVHPKKIAYMRKCRKAIKEHHEKMKDDPEHLTTSFLVKMTGCNCDRMRN
jgi:hypothetical protein